MKNKLLEKMKRGEKVFGTFATIGGGITIECLGYAGLDFVVIDAEHGHFSYEDCLNMARAGEVSGITTIIRVPDYTRPFIHKMLNTGAGGLMIPCMESVDEMKALLKEGKYYPRGNHCFPFSRNSCWGTKLPNDSNDYYEELNEFQLLIPQAETAGFLENCEEIMSMEGIDGTFLGPADMSASLGILKEYDNPIYLDARKRIVKACKDAGKFSWTWAGTVEQAIQNFEDGFDGVLLGMDHINLISFYQERISDIKKVM